MSSAALTPLGFALYYYQVWILPRLNQVLRVQLLERLPQLSLRFHADSKIGDAMFRTFDILRRDRDGFYYFVERAGESYRFKGENVSATQVEQELLRVGGVREAVACGVAIPGYEGRAGLAVLVVDESFDVSALVALATRLPRSALPRFVRVVPELARTSSLKLKRRALGAQGVDPAHHTEPSWVFDGSRYRRLDPEAYRAVVTGSLRL